MPRHPFLLALVLVLPMTVSCTMVGLDESSNLGSEMLYHFNARLRLVIEHPKTWQTIEDPGPATGLAPYTIHWVSAVKKGYVPDIQVTALSLPLEKGSEGELLLDEFRSRHPQLTLNPDTQSPLPQNALSRYVAKGASRQCQTLFYETSNRAVSLSFCATPESFEKNLPVFEHMLSTFQVLD